MIIVTDYFYAEFDKINGMWIASSDSREEKTNSIWWKPTTWSLKPTVKVTTTYKVTIDYTRGHSTSNFTSTFSDYAAAQATFKKIVQQLKAQNDAVNQEVIDRLFQEALGA